MKKVIDLIYKSYLNKVNTVVKSNFQDWIINLSKYDKDSKRLLICIAIDTKFKLVNIEDYVNIFNNINYKDTDKPQLLFHKACEVNNAQYHFFSQVIDNINDYEYSSLVNLWIFSESYLNSYYKADDYPLIKDRLLNFETIDLEVSFDFEQDIRLKKIFWVTIKDTIDKLLLQAEVNGINKVNLIFSKLGLDYRIIYDAKPPEWVIVNYQKNIPEYFHQPVSVNADWKSKDGLFLSYYIKDGFGRTRATSNIAGTYLGIQERVHRVFNKSYQMNAEYIGKLEKCKKNTVDILKTAKNRFNEK